MIPTGENQSTLRKICPSAAPSTTNLTHSPRIEPRTPERETNRPKPWALPFHDRKYITLSSSLTKKGVWFYHNDRQANVVYGNNSCLLKGSYEAHKDTVRVKCRIFSVIPHGTYRWLPLRFRGFKGSAVLRRPFSR
jgi:hypothetical protein